MKSWALVFLFSFLAAQFAGCAASRESSGKSANPDAQVAAPDSTPNGQALYAVHCLSCHQADGGGVPNMQPGILDSPWVMGEPHALALFVLSGGFNSAQRKQSAVDNVMPEFRHLEDPELAQILTFVRQKFGNRAGQVTAADVAQARKELPAL